MAQNKHLSYNDIPDLNADWKEDVTNGKPYAGESVQRFIKKTFNGKAGDFFYDADTSKYLVFADADARELYLSDREEYASLLLGAFDAPANYVAEINMATPASNVILYGATGNYVDFTFDVKSRTGASTGEAVVATFTFNNGGNQRRVTQVYSAGTNVHFLVDDYLLPGTNSISVVVTGRNTLAAAMAAVSFTVVALELTSTFDFSVPVTKGNDLAFTYTLSGSGVKYLEWYVDGVVSQVVDTITDLRVERVKYIDTSEMAVGKHSIQARAYFTNDGNNYYGATLYYDFVVAPTDGQWAANETDVLLGLKLSAPATSGIYLTAQQYKELHYDAAVFDSRERVLTMTVSDNGTAVQSITMQPEEIQSLVYAPDATGAHVLAFGADGATATVSVTVESSDININEVTDNMLLKLSAKGRSNSEANPGVWTYGSVATTFNGFAWNEQSGWNNGALVIPAGASIDISMAPLGGNPVTNGRTIEIDFETSKIENDDAGVISLVNSQTGAGLTVTASSARLQSSGGANVNTKFNDGDRVHLAFIVNRLTGDNGRLIFIVNNGNLERAAAFAAADVFGVGDNLHIGSLGCTVKVHGIRVYDRALTPDEAFQNFAVDSDDVLQVAAANDVLNEATGLIDADKVNARIPIIIITGDMQPIFDATDKNVTVYVDMEYRNLQDPTKNFTATHVRMRPQGTSSLGYPRKNLRPYTAAKYGCEMRDYNGDVLEDGLYAFKDGAQPVNCWTLKADYAESSGSHNTGVARLWNKLMYDCQLNGEFALRTEAQKTAITEGYNYDVRTAIDGFPIVVFHRQTASSELVCLGQYNFNNDKSTEKVFGFTDIPGFDNTHVQCFEFLANESPICLFDDVTDFDTDWADAFESRYPDTKTPNLAPLKTLATWVNSCKNNQAKWNSEKAAHFDLPKLAAYYVYLMRFGAVDQTVKNAMITTEDGVHWFFINYDNDTVIGIDNISTVLNAWNYDRTSQKTGGAYYFAGHNSVLWNCFEADQECMALVAEVDNALYSAGLTYANMIKMFDEEQCDKWCERIYNDNGVYKYIQPYKEKGSAVLYMLQGSRKSYRHWWLQHRMDLYDAKWSSGAYRNRIVRFIAEGAPGGTFGITAASDTFFGYGINSVVQEAGVAVSKNQSHDFTIERTLAIGDPVAIYNANNIKKVDLSDFVQYLTTLYVNQAVGNDGTSQLKSLILGDGTTQNQVFTEIGGLNVITGLEEIDIRNFTAMTSIELGALANLHILKAEGSGLTSFAPAAGVTLTTVTLPASLQTLSLNAASVAALTYTPTTTLRAVSLRNVTGTWDAKAFVNTWLALLSDAQLANAELTLTGIDWTGMTADQAIVMGKVGTRNYQGKITLSSLTLEQYNQLVELYGANVFNAEGSFVIDAPTQVFISGPSSVKEGASGTFTATFFPVTEAAVKYLLYNGTTLIEAQTDQQGNVYRTYNGVTLYEATGVMSVGTIASDVAVKVRAQVDGTTSYSEYLEVSAQKLSYPTAVTIDGQGTVNSNGMYNYTKSLTGTYNAAVTNVAWSLSSNSASTLYASDADGATVNVTNTPATSIDVTLECVVTFEGGVTRTGTKTITMVLTVPSSLSISGPATLDDNGTFDYTKAFNTDNYTSTLLSVVWSLTNDQSVVIKSSDNNGATLEIANGNDTAKTLTLTCTATFTGNVTVVGTKSISVDVIAPPVIEMEYVDLGLPSGLLWASWNVGALSPTDYGDYFSWGNIDGHAEGSGYDFSDANYNASPGKQVSGDIALSQDAANAYLGGSWRMPTKDEFQELYDNCDSAWVTENGVAGSRFTSKTNGNSIFFPAAGHYYGTTHYVRGSDGYYWSASRYSGSSGYSLGFSSGNVKPQDNGVRRYGFSVRAVMEPPKYVDLGLPSGTKWAKGNIVSKGNGVYDVGSETDYGAYVSWGNIAPHFSSDGSTFDDGYDFGTSNSGPYASTPGASVSADISSSDSAHDTALALLGSQWCLPTKEQFHELYDNTDNEWTTINGVAGRKFMKKSDHSVYVFFPAAGYGNGASLDSRGSRGYYWSSSWDSANAACRLDFNDSTINTQLVGGRYFGYSVRAVLNEPKTVDLGLPSGRLWADRNVGALSPSDYGEYFSWGNVDGHKSSNGSTFDDSYDFGTSTYNSTPGASIPYTSRTKNADYSADSGYDAARENLSGDWRMPTATEFKELYDNTDNEWTTINGVNGRKFMKKSDHSVYVFFPAAGCANGTSLIDSGSFGLYWSSSLYNTDNGHFLYFYVSNIDPQDHYNRYRGFSVRAVQ